MGASAHKPPQLKITLPLPFQEALSLRASGLHGEGRAGWGLLLKPYFTHLKGHFYGLGLAKKGVSLRKCNKKRLIPKYFIVRHDRFQRTLSFQVKQTLERPKIFSQAYHIIQNIKNDLTILKY